MPAATRSNSIPNTSAWSSIASQLRRDGAWQDRLLPDKISLARRESDFEKDMADGRVTALIVLDDVRVGDVVRITLHHRRQQPDPRRPDTTTCCARPGARPLLDTHLRVLFDPGTDVRWRLDNGARRRPCATDADGVEVQRATRMPPPSVQDEDDYPVWY